MQQIICRYCRADSPYVFPILTISNKKTVMQEYEKVRSRYNRHLRKIGEMAGVGRKLTSYVARHSWASIAKSKHIPTAIISEGMGHDSEQTTRIYLASLDTSVVDKANKKILDLL
jgi:integrase